MNSFFNVPKQKRKTLNHRKIISLLFDLSFFLMIIISLIIFPNNGYFDTNKNADWLNDQNDLIRVQQGDMPSNASNFKYYKTITIDNSKVNGAGSLENFPVLISILDSDLHDEVQASGNDIAFAIGLEWLDHEIEYFNQTYNNTHAQLVAWVRVPFLSTSVDTIITMFFGNSTMNSQENPEGVWDSNYKGVWHLSENVTDEQTTGIHFDSTQNSNDGTQHNNDDINELIGHGQDFDGTGDYINVARSSSIEPPDQITFQAWFYWDDHSTSQYGDVIRKSKNETGDPFMSYCIEQASTTQVIEVGMTINGNDQWVNGGVLSEDEWHYLVATWNSGYPIYFYIDGSVASSSSPIFGAITYYDTPLGIGHNSYGPTQPGEIDGKIDEVRVSSYARSSDWIATEYNNQHEPDSFYTIGSIQSTDITAPTYSNLTESADPLELYFTETISINVTDPAGVSQVLIEFESSNHSMTNIIGDIWQYDSWTPPSNGTYPYTIWMEDNNHNWNFTSNSIEVTPDVTPPTYSSPIESADPLQLGQNETITINVFDSPGSGVNQVLLEYDSINHTMNSIGGNAWRWEKWKPASENVYNYSIYMEDNVGNWNVTSGNITVRSTFAPIINNLTFSENPLQLGNNITIYVDVYDIETDVSVVLIELENLNYTMTNYILSTYKFTWTKNETGDIPFTIWANDTENNWNQYNDQFKIIDTTGPSFRNLNESENPLEFGNTETITIIITDLSVFIEAKIEFQDSNDTMENIGGNIWKYDFWMPPSTGNYSYIIWARDKWYNWNSTSSYILVQDTISPHYSSLVRTAQSGGSVDPLEFGDTLIITIILTDLSGINQSLLEYKGQNYSLSYIWGYLWGYPSWTPSNRDNNTYKIFMEDKSGNWNYTIDWIMVNDTTAPLEPILTISPSGDVSGLLEFDWMNGYDPSGIDYYLLIISTSSDPNNTTARVLFINTTISYYKLTSPLSLGNYYFFLCQVDTVGHNSSYTIGTFNVVMHNPGSPGEDNFIMLIIIILIISVALVSLMISIFIVKRKGKGVILPSQKKIPFKVIKTHIDKISILPNVIDKKPLKKEAVTDDVDKKSLKKQLNEVRTLAEEFFAEGAYFEGIAQYELAVKILIKLGKKEEASLYVEKLDQIKKLLDERDDKLETLEMEKAAGHSLNVVQIYYDIIEISKNLNDFVSVEMYQSELIEIFHTNQLLVEDLEMKRKDFAGRADLELNNNRFERAAEFYEKCEKISYFFVQMGREEEMANMQRFKDHKDQCLNKK